MKKGTRKTSKNKNVTIDDLAVMVANGFGRVEKRFEGVDERFERIESDIKELREEVKATRRDVLDIGDRFVPRYEFDNLLVRFSRLEQKVMGKRK